MQKCIISLDGASKYLCAYKDHIYFYVPWAHTKIYIDLSDIIAAQCRANTCANLACERPVLARIAFTSGGDSV